ncbi:MAG: RNA polymerase sigma factor [Gemmatimonadaceae bacterium]
MPATFQLVTSHDDSSADADLLARLRAGDESALEMLFREHYERLCRTAAAMLGSEAEAEELVQDVLFHIWEHRAEITITQTLGGYLRTAVRNRALNASRRSRLELRLTHRAGPGGGAVRMHGRSEGADEAMAANDLAAAFERALDNLTPRCREAFVLRLEQRLSYADIARLMNIAPKTVEVHLGMALRILRQQLAEWLTDAR